MEASKRSLVLGGLAAFIFLTCLATAFAEPGPLGLYEPSDRVFKEGEFGNKLVYYHQRMIGEATVEKDHTIYHFDKDTGELLARIVAWRDDLPDELPLGLISSADAEDLVGGDVQFTKLYYISPESYVFPLDPAPRNPCWVVRSVIDGRVVFKVVDAVDGVILGDGVPPPYTAFSFSGPWECPYYGAWTTWYQNAAYWFDHMGYSTEQVKWPTFAQIRSHVKSDHSAMFYELNHGGSDSFMYGCDEATGLHIQAFRVNMWMNNRAKMPFTFLGSCEGMCDTGPASFSYEFRKGSEEATTTVGYCHMAETWCSDCWTESIEWQIALFDYMDAGHTVYDSYLHANSTVPSCGLNDCMRFAGDPSFAVVPVVARDPIVPEVEVYSPNGGEVLEYNTDHEITWNASDNARVVSVTIVLSTDSGVSYPDTIAKDEENDGSFMWTVPDVDSETARIKVVAFDGVPNEGADESDGDFTLVGSSSGVGRAGFSDVPERAVLLISGGSVLNSSTSIVFGLPVPSQVRLSLYDVAGRHLRDLVNGHREDGYHEVGWDCTRRATGNLGSGIYFLRLDTGSESLTTKVVIAR